MPRFTDDQKTILSLVGALYDTIKEAGSQGAPAGSMYIAASAGGMTIHQFEALMGLLEQAGKVRQSNHCYFAV